MITTELLASKQTKDMEEQLPKHLAALTWPKKTISLVRQNKLRHLLMHAKKRSPWYKNQLKHVDPENFTEKMLADLPSINKKILMDNWDEIVTDSRLSLSLVESHLSKMAENNELLYLLDRYRLLVTSGSSGQRGIFIYSWDEWNTYYSMYKRYRFYNADRTRMILNPMQKISVGAVIGTNPIHSLYSLEKSYRTRNLTSFHFPINSPMIDIINGLNKTQPDILLGSSSTVFKLAKETAEGKLCISPKIVSVFGEPLYPLVRQMIKETWPFASLFNTFGTSEGLSASYCRADSHNMHLNDDLCIAEPVDASGNPAKKGEFSKKIYITNLFNYTLPLIKYEIPDEVMLLENSCSCGSQHQLIAEPKNRPDFDFTYNGNIFVNHIVFAYPLLKDKCINEYQVVQTKEGATINIVATGHADITSIRNLMIASLKKLGLCSPIIDFVELPSFKQPISGKLRRFIPLEKPQETTYE